MADDIMMLDQAMDTDSNLSVVPPTTNSATDRITSNRNPLYARRNISNPKDSRGRIHEALKPSSAAKIQTSYASTSKTVSHQHQAYNISAVERIKHRGLRKQQVIRAIADGSFRVTHDTDLISQRGDGTFTHAGDGTSNPGDNSIYAPPHDERDMANQIRRLDANLVAAALFEPIPGMTFDPTAPCAFTSDHALMADLVQALEAFQMHIARKGKVVLSHKAGGLLRGLARDVLHTMVKQRQRGGVEEEESQHYWAGVARDYVRGKKITWLASRYLFADPCRTLMVGRTESLWDFVGMLLEAVECPGKHYDLVQALGPLGDGMPSFIVAQPATLQALISHFETARARYLVNLKNSHGSVSSNNTSFHQTGAAGLGKLPRGGNRQYDSSEDEDEDKGPRGGMFDGGAEDDGQVAEDVPSEPGQWFLVNLDRFTAPKSGQQKGGIDGAMLSTLDLGGDKSNV